MLNVTNVTRRAPHTPHHASSTSHKLQIMLNRIPAYMLHVTLALRHNAPSWPSSSISASSQQSCVTAKVQPITLIRDSAAWDRHRRPACLGLLSRGREITLPLVCCGQQHCSRLRKGSYVDRQNGNVFIWGLGKMFGWGIAAIINDLTYFL